MMKKYSRKDYVFVFRFFSGLRCIMHNTWRPTGAPAIYKLLEHINNKGIDSWVIFLCKSVKETDEVNKVTHIDIGSLENIHFTIIPFYRVTRSTRIDYIINGLIQFILVFKYVMRYKPSILYCDRINMYIGAFFSYFKRPKVVLRMLGVLDYVDFYRNKINALRYPLSFFSIKAPFSYIICSRDGSPGEYFLRNYVNKNTPYVVWLNGVEKLIFNKEFNHPEDKIRILFVSRLEQDKGIIELIETIKIIKSKELSSNFQLIVVGDGSLKGRINNMIQSYNLSNCIHIKGALSHREIFQYYREADVYISLNKKGNLNNTVLEAFGAGECIMMLEKSKDGVDEDTESLIPYDCALRVSRNNTVNDLSEKLTFLLNNPHLIEEYKGKARSIAPRLIKSWEERLGDEEKLLKHLVFQRN